MFLMILDKGAYIVHICLQYTYLDDLSKTLNDSSVGCYVGNILINRTMCADDVCLFCPSGKGLQNLMDLCADYTKQHCIVVNSEKTVYLMLNSKKLQLA